MTVRTRRLALASSMAAVLFVSSGSSMADPTKDQCVDANAKAQDLRRDGKLGSAREQLRVCADLSCPTMVRDDCTRRLDELENAQPSLVFDLKDAAGADVIDVRVTVDGQPLVDHLDGKPLRIDPGPHVFTFEVAGQPTLTARLLVKEGEGGRHEHLVVGNARVAPEVFAPPATPSSGLGPRKVVGLSLAAVGLVGLGVGTAFGFMASSAWKNAKDACGGDVSHCVTDGVPTANSQHDKAVTDGTVATIGFIAGGVLVAAGAVVFFTAGHREGSPAARVMLAPRIGTGQVGVALTAAF